MIHSAVLLVAVLAPTGGDGPDREALQAWKEALHSRHESQRLEALAEIGKASAALDQPERDLGKLLADALDDESYEVRTRAALLLADDQHPAVAVPALLEALDTLEKELARKGRNSGAKRDREQKSQQKAWNAYADAVVTGLGSLPDDRCVRALCQFYVKVPRQTSRALRLRVAQALIELGARDGIEVLIRSMVKLDANQNRQDGRKTNRERDDSKSQGARLHALLTEAARARQLEGMPASWSPSADTEWNHWFTKNQKRFPAKLGKL